MTRAGRLLPACLAAAGVLAGCAGGGARPVETGVARVNDPTFGLPNFAEFRTAMPIRQTEVYRTFAQEADTRRAPAELRGGAAADTGLDPHPSWRADFPVERQPARRRFFISGFTAGFAARLAYGAYRGASTGTLAGSDFGASLLAGVATGLLSWSYSFRLPPATLARKLAEDQPPSVEETSVFRENSGLAPAGDRDRPAAGRWEGSSPRP